MTQIGLVFCIISFAGLISCAPSNTPTQNIDPMRAEFMESCAARPEYVSKRRDGTIDRYCGCVFDRTMKGLTEEQRILAGFYLYGEQSEAFKSRYEMNPDSLQYMGVVSKAIGNAAKVCR